jgi:preprotein translocase SecE subunit
MVAFIARTYLSRQFRTLFNSNNQQNLIDQATFLVYTGVDSLREGKLIFSLGEDMAKQGSDKTIVRRVKASSVPDSSAARTDDSIRVVKPKQAKSPKSKISKTSSPALLKPFFAIGRYFRDSWRELRQVRWPNRRATWALTLAVLLFSLFFIVLIMLFDWIFNFVIQEVIL